MPMLFWALALLGLGVVAAIGMCVAVVRRLNRLEVDYDERITDLARSAARLTADIVRVNEDTTLLINAAHDHPAEDEIKPSGPATAPIEEVVTEAVDRVVAEAPTTEWPVVEQRDIGGRTFSFRR